MKATAHLTATAHLEHAPGASAHNPRLWMQRMSQLEQELLALKTENDRIRKIEREREHLKL